MASSATAYSPKVQKRTLKGHRKQVLCISHPGDHAKYSSTDAHIQHHHPSLLLSGSEDGTARLWDLRMRKTAYCIIAPAIENDPTDVNAVAFHPSIIEDGLNESGDTTIFASRQDCMVYVSTGTNIFGYDLRHHANNSTGPIIKTPYLDLSSSFQCLDEINQLSFSFPKRSKDGSRNYQMAAVDDCGEVHIPSEYIPQSILSQQSPISPKHTVLHHAEHGSHTIASSAVFRPRVNGTYVASGGTDCMVKLFDVTKPKRATSSIHIKPAESENTTQICNPPFIHSLQWSPSGRLLAAGVGDGSCVILRGEGNRLVEIGRLGQDQGGHGSAVAAVCFPGFGSSTTKSASVEAEDRLLISAGNDGKILFWDLGGNMVDGDALDPLLYLGVCSGDNEKVKNEDDELQDTTNAINSITISSKKSKSKNKKKGKTNSQHKASNTDDDLFLDDLLPSPPKVLFQIPHNQKPNWITCSRASDEALPSSVFVADTTNDISIYSFPTS